MTDDDFLQDYKRRTLKEHVTLGQQKAMSYLPLKTIERVLGLTVDEYRREIEQAGNECIVLSEDETCRSQDGTINSTNSLQPKTRIFASQLQKIDVQVV